MKPVDAKQIREELAHPVAQELLAKTPLSRLAYNGPDGLPRVIPIGFFWDGHNVVVCTATTAPKVAALQARPEVALTIDVGDSPGGAKALMIRGVAAIDIVDGVPDEYLAQTKKGLDETLGPEGLAEFERNVRSMYAQMARIRIEPRWVRLFDFGGGRLPAFLQELADNTGS